MKALETLKKAVIPLTSAILGGAIVLIGLRLSPNLSQKITASKIYDITGNVIQDCTYTDTCNEINMSNLSKGLYLIQLSTSSNANTTFKVLKN